MKKFLFALVLCLSLCTKVSAAEEDAQALQTDVIKTALDFGESEYKESYLSTYDLSTYGDSNNGGYEGLYYSNVTPTTATLDWSKARFSEMVRYTNITPKFYKVSLDNNKEFTVPLNQTSCTITGLDSGMYNYVFVYYVYDIIQAGQTEEQQEWLECHFTTPGALADNDASVAGGSQAGSTETTGAATAAYSETSAYEDVLVSQPVPYVSKIAMEENKITALINGYGNVDGLECFVYDKSGKLVTSQTSISSSLFYFYNIKANNIYYVTVRSYVYANGQKLYFGMSGKKYVIAQPKISSNSKKLKIKQNYISFSWGKVKGASSYIVYARKRYANKWIKVGTTKKTKYKLTKIKGKKINCKNNNYEITVVAKGKAGGQKLTSERYAYVYTYTYYTTR